MARAWTHVRGAPNHPRPQGKIERRHQTLNNRVLLENYDLPSALEQAVKAFVEHYNHDRYHARASETSRRPTPTSGGTEPSQAKGVDQGENHETAPLDQPEARGINCNRMSQTLQKAITSNSPIYLTEDTLVTGGTYRLCRPSPSEPLRSRPRKLPVSKKYGHLEGV